MQDLGLKPRPPQKKKKKLNVTRCLHINLDERDYYFYFQIPTVKLKLVSLLSFAFRLKKNIIYCFKLVLTKD